MMSSFLSLAILFFHPFAFQTRPRLDWYEYQTSTINVFVQSSSDLGIYS
jgi:hypothetical protein